MLKSKAKIEYVGAFADMKKSESATPVSPEAKSEKELPAAKHTSDTQLETEKSKKVITAPNTNQSNIDKGLSGL